MDDKMADSTTKRKAHASDLRAKPILVDVPGTDLQIECRRPDPLALAALGVLPLDVFGAVLEQLASGANLSEVVNNQPVRTFSELIDRWACAAAVSPRLVMTQAEASDDENAIWFEDLEPVVRFAIWRATNDRIGSSRVVDALASFREHQSADTLARSGGEAVRNAAEPVAQPA